MAESTLSLKLSDLLSLAGFYLGYGRTAANWSADQLAAVTECVNAGYRKFLYPPILPGEREAHDWSFLRPVSSLTLLAAGTTIALPDDFAGAEGQVVVNHGTGGIGYAINLTSIGAVLTRLQTESTASGRPVLAAVEPLAGTSSAEGQRFQMRVWPAADVQYTLQVQYYAAPNALSTGNPYPVGGPEHAETMKLAVLAAAEQTMDDALTTNSTMFLQQLAASVAMDRKKKPQNLGYNGDRSDALWTRRQVAGSVTYNGVLYD